MNSMEKATAPAEFQPPKVGLKPSAPPYLKPVISVMVVLIVALIGLNFALDRPLN